MKRAAKEDVAAEKEPDCAIDLHQKKKQKKKEKEKEEEEWNLKRAESLCV